MQNSDLHSFTKNPLNISFYWERDSLKKHSSSMRCSLKKVFYAETSNIACRDIQDSESFARGKQTNKQKAKQELNLSFKFLLPSITHSYMTTEPYFFSFYNKAIDTCRTNVSRKHTLVRTHLLIMQKTHGPQPRIILQSTLHDVSSCCVLRLLLMPSISH